MLTMMGVGVRDWPHNKEEKSWGLERTVKRV